ADLGLAPLRNVRRQAHKRTVFAYQNYMCKDHFFFKNHYVPAMQQSPPISITAKIRPPALFNFFIRQRLLYPSAPLSC
ncbi:MAG: hypothetical protein Q4C61_17585, partial [Lachnospiraceae bacterium]|nr:hypothetical protein [Lachnospiraceae bacterium]